MYKQIFSVCAAISLLIMGCDKENTDLVVPLTADSYPQVIKLDDESGGGTEGEDEFSCVITLNDRVDPTGKEISGTIVPLTTDVIVLFEIKDLEGFTSIGDYIKSATALYEIDDCTTSQDQNIDLDVQLDLTTGKGSFRFPKNVAEVELVFETDDDFFDDNVPNTTDRSLAISLTGVTAMGNEAVEVNTAKTFSYFILDDEAIHGDWELDVTDPVKFAAFKQLMGLINTDIAALDVAEVDKIEISFEHDEVSIKVELVATDKVTECGVTETKQKEIGIEMDIAELSTLSSDGTLALEGEIEQTDGSIKEFSYEGSFAINGNSISLQLDGEYDNNEVKAVILQLNK